MSNHLRDIGLKIVHQKSELKGVHSLDTPAHTDLRLSEEFTDFKFDTAAGQDIILGEGNSSSSIAY